MSDVESFLAVGCQQNFSGSMYDNADAKKKLVAALRTKQAVLLSGAGTGISVGYPSWRQLVEMLRKTFADHLTWPHDAIEITFANEIVAEIRKNGKEHAYLTLLFVAFAADRNQHLASSRAKVA